MAELEIDHSNLPRVQEVCQNFAVLEDGVLAHNLQEQEIEQHYTTNIQKNQLVQNDIRVAKQMQDEEEEQQAQQSAIFRQASRQIEEQDFEYARVIQEELQRRAEEACRREQDDAEMAKRLQEEEEQWVRRRSRGQESHGEGSTSEPLPLSSHQHSLSSLHQGEEQYSSSTTRGQCSTSNNGSQFNEPQPSSPRRVAAQKSRTSWSNQGHIDSISQMRGELRETLSDESEDSDTVFREQLSLWSQRLHKGLKTAPPRHRASFRQPNERSHRSSFKDEFKGWEEETEVWDERNCENDDLQKRIHRNLDRQSCHRTENEDWHRCRDIECRFVEVGQRQHNRSESVRVNDRSRYRNRDLARTWSYKENPDKHVRFKDDNKSCYKQQSESNQVWEMLGLILRERGVPVRLGGTGVPLQIRPQSRDGQVLHGSEGSYGDSQPHQRGFQRAATTRHSFHGDMRQRRRLSHRENGWRDHREDPDRLYDNGEGYKLNSEDASISFRERQGSRRWKDHKYKNDDKNGERIDCRVRRTTSERRHWHKITEERLSSEEEQEVERGVTHPRPRALQHSQSLSSSSSSSSSRASARHRSSRMAGGASVEPEVNEESLDLGELHQVLQDEQLARRLQEEEEKLSRRKTTRQSSPHDFYPEGDFRVAQVAQDEEIARFMQKQEMKSKRRSRELEGPGSWREHRVMISHHDRHAARDRQVQRERLDSEGLPSPTEDCPPEIQPPSPISTTPKAMNIRNIAEELDPTFQARRQSTEGLRVGPTGPTCESPPLTRSGLHDFLEEPTFIPPTKRQTDKSGHAKPKEKEKNCKQQ